VRRAAFEERLHAFLEVAGAEQRQKLQVDLVHTFDSKLSSRDRSRIIRLIACTAGFGAIRCDLVGQRASFEESCS
jgi:hypothetical protein